MEATLTEAELILNFLGLVITPVLSHNSKRGNNGFGNPFAADEETLNDERNEKNVILHFP